MVKTGQAAHAEGLMRVLAVVPAFNEQQSLPALIAEIRASGCDVVVIDDASTDGTEQAARKSRVPVISLPNNLGVGGAVQTGFLFALRRDYDIVVQVDGDGQHDPQQIPTIIAPIIAGEADCVVGSRYHPAKPDLNYRTPILRRLGMRFSTAILWLFTGVRINDTTSGFRALNRRAVAFFARKYPSDHPEAEALLVLHQAGFRLVEVPVTMRSRTAGSSLFSLFRAAVYPLRVTVGFLGQAFKRA
jgi:glycosyltransferase involved in cell wall biosynthesis